MPTAMNDYPRSRDGLGGISREPQPSFFPIPPDHFFETRFVDRNLAFIERGDSLRGDIDADHLVAALGVAHTTYQPDIALLTTAIFIWDFLSPLRVQLVWCML